MSGQTEEADVRSPGAGPGIGVVGCGRWGQNHLRTWSQLGLLRAACDHDAQRLDAVAAAYPGLSTVPDAAELVARDDVDAVVVSTPAATHARIALQVMEAGKDVLVEKPLALSVSEAEVVLKAASSNGRLLMVGHVLEYHPAVRRLRSLVEEGALGRVRYLYSNRLNFGTLRTEESALWSFAPHDIAVMLRILGATPEDVTCRGGAWLNRVVADVTVMSLAFPGEIRAHLFVSWLHPFKEQRLVVVGDEQMAVFDDNAPWSDKLVLYPHHVDWQGDRTPLARRAEAVAVPLDEGEPLLAECRHFADAVRDRRAVLTDGASALEVLEVIEAGQRSLGAGGHPVAVGGHTAAQAGAGEGADDTFVHPTAVVDQGARLGSGARVWHYTHVMAGACIGSSCTLGQNVFVVGDQKQSIFSFQGADPAEFTRVHGLFDRRSRDAERPFHTIPLETSFRSVSAVLELVDAVFARDPALDGVAPEPPHHFVSERRRLDSGLVELWPLLGPSESDEPPAWEPPTEQRGISDPGARLAKLIAARIAGWLRDGAMLESKGRPIRPGDVLILVRTRNRFFVELMRALKAANVPVGGMDRMVLTEQLAVMDLMALARFLLLPEDDLSLAELLKGPLVGFDDDRLFALAYGRPGTLWAAMAASPDPAVKAARAWLSEILNRVDFQAPFELFSGVLAQPCPGDPASGRRAMLGRLGPEAEDPLDELLSLALGFERQLPPSLQRFLHWLETGETEVKREQEQGDGQVRIMTVHGSKGLQAPIVILPDLVGMPRGGARAGEKILWPDETLPVPLWAPRAASRPPVYREAMERADRRRDQEYRRLLYVALTRAEDRLYLCGHYATERGKPAEGCWYHLCRDGLSTLADAVTVAIDDIEGEGLRLHRPQADRPAGPEATAPPALVEAPQPDWLHRPPPPEPDPTRPLTPSRPEVEPPARSPLEGSDQGRFRRGALIHALLQALPDLPPEAREAAARRYLARPQHGRDEAEQAEIVATTLAVLDQPGFEALFGPGSRAEVPVVGLVGGRALSGQIDRLVVTPDSVLVVDYKTNRPPPASIDSVPRAYLVQMAAYRAALRLVYPGRTVRCALLWTEGPKLMELPPATLDRHAPGASA
jgi:predicted dehydrogenase